MDDNSTDVSGTDMGDDLTDFEMLLPPEMLHPSDAEQYITLPPRGGGVVTNTEETTVHTVTSSSLIGRRVTSNTSKSNRCSLRALCRFVFEMKGEDLSKLEEFQILPGANAILFSGISCGHSSWSEDEMKRFKLYLIVLLAQLKISQTWEVLEGIYDGRTFYVSNGPSRRSGTSSSHFYLVPSLGVPVKAFSRLTKTV